MAPSTWPNHAAYTCQTCRECAPDAYPCANPTTTRLPLFEAMTRRPPQIAIGAATNLWIQWGWIALEHRDEARAARERDGGPPANNQELQASMISIAAAAFSIDGFATIVREHGAEPTLIPGAELPGRAGFVWETLRANFEVGAYTQTW